MRFRRKARSRRSGGFMKARSRRSSGSGTGALLGVAAAAAVYGFGRPYLEKAISPVTSKIPLGGFADEAVLGAVGYFAAKGKFGNNKIVKNIGMAMLVIESARVGSAVGSTMISGSSSTNVQAYDY